MDMYIDGKKVVMEGDAKQFKEGLEGNFGGNGVMINQQFIKKSRIVFR